MLNIAETTARKAGRIILNSLERLDTIEVSEKGRNDFVTDIDLAAENVIISALQETYPDHKIISEEAGVIGGNEDHEWIIDPLDGTKNFIHGLPHFSVSIAYKEKGKLKLGVIYDPVRDELFTATRGNGAHLNNKRIRVSQERKLEAALIGTGFPFRHAQHVEPYFNTLKVLFPQISGLRRAGSAALDLAYVAAGRLDGYWELGLNPWDIAAGVMILKEAGGLIADVQGSENYFDSGNVIAGNPKIFKALMKIIVPSLESA